MARRGLRALPFTLVWSSAFSRFFANAFGNVKRSRNFHSSTFLPDVLARTVCIEEFGFNLFRAENKSRLTFCALAFGTTFYFDCSVIPADNKFTSVASADASTARGGLGFATTHWSLVLEAQGDSPEADKALEKLCRTYWWPVYSFIIRQGSNPEEAKDLTQSFFALLFERRDLESVRREKGRLRSFFFASLKHFLAKERRYAAAVKRGDGRPLIPLDELLACKRADAEAADSLSPDRIFERR
jgi:hypothetical protein